MAIFICAHNILIMAGYVNNYPRMKCAACYLMYTKNKYEKLRFIIEKDYENDNINSNSKLNNYFNY